MNKIFDYSKLTFNELIEKISIARFFHLPKMVAEAFRKIPAIPEPNYKVYTALLTQTGTDAPVATVLENTLGGDVVWSYISTGYYKATSNGLFVTNKSYSSVVNPDYRNDIIDVDRNNSSEIILTTAYRANLTYTNGLLANTPIEIRVYS